MGCMKCWDEDEQNRYLKVSIVILLAVMVSMIALSVYLIKKDGPASFNTDSTEKTLNNNPS